MNRVMLVGRITRDPELRNSPNGVSFTSFSIAVNRQVPNAQGERVADFINCVAFNKQAENLTRFIRKGGLIGVEGKLQSRTYQAQDGTNRYAVDVICDSITFLESRNSTNQNNMNQIVNNQNPFNDYSSYESNYQQPQQQVNNQRNSFAQQQMSNQQQSTYRPRVETPTQSLPKEDSFADVEKQFDISDDDLPF